MSDKENTYELIEGQKLSFIKKVKLKHTIKLKELGFDLGDLVQLNVSRASLRQDSKKVKELYHLIFDKKISDEDLLEIDPFEFGEALDNFLALKCRLSFGDPPKLET